MNIVVFSSVSWSFLWQRPQHIASLLAKRGHKVVYFNEPHYIDSAEKLKNFLKHNKLVSVSEVAPNVWEVTLYLPPFRGKLSSIADRMLRSNFNHVFDKLKFRPDAALVYCLRFSPLLKTLQAQNIKIVFDYVDDLTAFPEFAIEQFEQIQDNFIGSSNVVFATSKSLCDRIKPVNPRCVYLPNAMDFEHFNHAATEKIPLTELASLKPPIIGYIGAFNDWVDADLVCKLAQIHPEYSLLIVGPINFGGEEMSKHQNILMVGTKPYQELPAYLSNIDVCIIPFKLNRITLASNPIKMYEYLASGKPVVSTALPEVTQNASEVVYIGMDEADFIAKVEAAVNERSNRDFDVAVQKRMSFAKANSWESRVDVIEAELMRLLKDTP
ncbi:MAG: glycosyltransferase [Candidatus Bathyarchaeota archaeon]|nr:glycosyltransferase [Candidatus Bathyarchaeota archaeon]